MFGKKRKYRKAAANLGVLLHRQLRTAVDQRDQIFESPEEIAFTSGYLNSFVWDALERRGCDDMKLQRKLLKYICDGIIPNRMWDIYQRGEALKELLNGSDREEHINMCKAYELGVRAGINDSSEGDFEQVVPENLTRFLLGKPVVGPGIENTI